MTKMFSGVNYIGLSTEDKPAVAKDGEAFLEVDTKKIYVYYAGMWYEQ